MLLSSGVVWRYRDFDEYRRQCPGGDESLQRLVWERFDEAFASLRQWEGEGRLVHRQTIFDGIESCVDALNGLFTGANIGKTLVKVSEPTPA